MPLSGKGKTSASLRLGPQPIIRATGVAISILSWLASLSRTRSSWWSTGGAAGFSAERLAHADRTSGAEVRCLGVPAIQVHVEQQQVTLIG
jgi:hypothetical protein